MSEKNNKIQKKPIDKKPANKELQAALRKNLSRRKQSDENPNR
ncbi:MAG: hypothetical protein ACJA0S_000717 [Rickettsiales bacterium]|jgi:hypothetical protein